MPDRYTLKNKTGINGLGAGVWNLGPGGDPFGGPQDREVPAEDAERALKPARANGLKCAMYTRSFFADAVFKDGGMTSNDAKGRKLALENALRAVDTTATLGAKTMVFWNGREGF